MLRTAAVLVVLLALPLAAAAAPLAGEVAWGDDARLDGRLDARTADGILDLTPDAARGLRVSWARAEGYRTESVELRGPAGPGYQEPTNQSLSWSAGALEVLACDAGCRILAWVEGGDDGRVGVTGDASGPLARAEGSRTDGGRVAAPVLGGTVRYRLPETWLAPPPLEDAVPEAEGRVRLFVWGARVRVEDEAGAREVWTGERTEPAAPLVPVTRTRAAEMVLRIEDASVAAPPGSEARLAARALDLALSGEARADAATGWVSLGGRRVELSDDPLALVGSGLRLHVAPRAVHGQDATLGGEADRVTVAGGTLRGGLPPASAVAPVAVGGGLLALFLAWRALAFLSSRLTRDALLDNPNRARVYDAVRASPGTHVSAISRATGIGRVVVQHHLRALETHKLVTRRQGTKLLTYYASDGVPTSEDLAARETLRDPARRAVAAAVARESGATARGLAAAVGMSRRRVDYHLARLEAAGLLRREGFLPARFAATERLRVALQTVSIRHVAATDGVQS